MCNLLSKLTSLFKEGGQTGEIPSPRTIRPGQVAYRPVTQFFAISDVPDGAVTTVGPSNSMEPLIDEGHQVLISRSPTLIDAIIVGDIIIYRDPKRQAPYDKVIHSVIEIGEDTEGWYCRCRGLNNNHPDEGKIRKSQVEWVAVGVIWTGTGL